MRRWCAPLRPADRQRAGVEVHLVPAEIDQLGYPEAVAVRHQDHGRVPMAPSVIPGGLLKALHLGIGQVFAGPQLGIGKAERRNCSFFDGWRDQLEVGFCHDNQPPRQDDRSNNSRKTNSSQASLLATFRADYNNT
jgi:hypothetical protein